MTDDPQTRHITQHFTLPSPEQPITPAWSNAEHYQIWVKRDDLIHPIVSGNKLRKLRYSIKHLLDNNIRHVISFGGGYSNHLHALAYVCKHLNIKLTAIVRGHYQSMPTPMLRDLAAWQVNIEYVDRKIYQQRDQADYLASLMQRFPDALVIPEGGSSQLALDGVADIISELTQTYDYILTPVGSGGTLAGLVHGITMQPTAKWANILGIGVLKGQGYLEELVNNLLHTHHHSVKLLPTWNINHKFHFNGYAKSTPELEAFCQSVNRELAIPIEPVYSGKLFWAAKELMAQGTLPKGSKILLIHTGGLQGARQ